MATVICLDDYHCLDRFGRKEKGVTALDPKAQDFELMYDQVKAIRDGKPIDKPIYNHVSGLLDPPETIKPPKVSRPAPARTLPGLSPFRDIRCSIVSLVCTASLYRLWLIITPFGRVLHSPNPLEYVATL